MTDRKILVFILFVIIYFFYHSVNVWFARDTTDDNKKEIVQNTEVEKAITDEPVRAIENKTQTNNTGDNNSTQKNKRKMNKKVIPLYIKDACSILQIFTEKATPWIKHEKFDMENSAVTAICLTVFLVTLAIHAVLDVIKAKEEQKAKLKMNPGGERRPSLAEFANKKYLRRESSRFGLQMFQISESVISSGSDDKIERKQKKTYTRGESINSYLSDKKSYNESSSPATVGELSTESPLTKRQSVSKLFGGRPAGLVRRSSFPALPINPEIQALMLGHRQTSVDSDDEDKGRRVRFIRRY